MPLLRLRLSLRATSRLPTSRASERDGLIASTWPMTTSSPAARAPSRAMHFAPVPDSLWRVGDRRRRPGHTRRYRRAGEPLRAAGDRVEAWTRAYEAKDWDFVSAYAGLQLAQLQAETDQLADVLRTTERLVKRFGRSADSEIRAIVAEAILTKGDSQAEADPRAAVATYEALAPSSAAHGSRPSRNSSR